MSLGSVPRALAPLLAVLAAAASPGTPARAAYQLPVVTVIGDSVPDSIANDQQAQSILGNGIALNLQLAPCRRVEQESCPYGGVRPPNVIDLVASLGSQLGQTVIVAVGYNDSESLYAQDIADTLAALRQAGVTRILWLTLRAERASYLSMNDDIRAAAASPDVAIVDWNLYSRSHPEWFQPDGLHLVGTGAEAMAQLFHDRLDDLGIPFIAPPPPPARPAATQSTVHPKARPKAKRAAGKPG